MAEPLDGTGLDGLVQIAYLHAHTVSHSWHESMMRLVSYDAGTSGRIVSTAGPHMIRADSGGLVAARNLAVQSFLDDTPHEWLFIVDTDMGFAPDTVERLVQAADPAQRPVVGALCFALRELGYDGMGGRRVMPVPTMYTMAHTPEGHVGFANRFDVPDNTLVQVAATGAACLLLHRGAVEKVRANGGDHWFDQVRYEDGRLLSEDLSFCYRLGAAGIPVFVHTGVKTTHHKQVWIGADDYTPPPPGILNGWPPAQPPPDVAGLPCMVDIAASLASLAGNDHVKADGMLKLDADLDRYRQLIEATRPEVIVETGTRTGASSLWFASQPGVDLVITVDVDALVWPEGVDLDLAAAVETVTGDSADPLTFAKVAELVDGRRCMVSLDSDHSAGHVAEEIGLYGPLVSPGCYLVVEDGIFAYAPPALRQAHFPAGLDGSPLDAVAALLAGSDEWSRDAAVERLHPVTHHPAGWWMRRG